MPPVVLFDWGDTLMRDFHQYSGRMCDWPEVAAVPGAREALAYLSRSSRLYVVSGAADSSPDDIRRALARVHLDRFITGCFCRRNTGFDKPDRRFYQTVLDILGVGAGEVTMVGDNLDKDILPCHQLGMETVLLATADPPCMPLEIRVVRTLGELCR